MKIIVQLGLVMFLGISPFAFGQIKEEKLILDRQREPEIKRIEKQKTSVPVEKNYPPKEKKTEDSLHLKYRITDVPLVSNFEASTIQGTDISPQFNSSYQDNYFQIGYGNYGKLLADGLFSTTLQNKMEIGADIHYLSTNGLKKVYDWDSDQYKGNAAVFLNGYGEKGKFNINAEYGVERYNYYGIYAMHPSSDVNILQKTNRFAVNGYYDFYSNEILNDLRVKSSFLTDHYGANENKVELLANLSKHEVTISQQIQMNADLGLNFATQKTDFDIVNHNSSQHIDFDLVPQLKFIRGESYLMIGSGFTFIHSKYDTKQVATQTKENRTYWFPKAELLLSTGDKLKFYAGVDGGLHLNSYERLLQDNPYLLSDQRIEPTRTKYQFYFGLKGDISENVKYDVSAGYSKLKNISFFAGNDLLDKTIDGARNGYDYANTFSVAYDHGTSSWVKGSLDYYPLTNLNIDASLEYNKYSLDHYKNIYNNPVFKAEIGAKYQLVNNKLQLGFKGYFVSDRTANIYSVVPSELVYTTSEDINHKVGGYADLNLSAEYKFHKNFSIFANGNNLLNSKYQRFAGYKVLGAQILGGIKITF